MTFIALACLFLRCRRYAASLRRNAAGHPAHQRWGQALHQSLHSPGVMLSEAERVRIVPRSVRAARERDGFILVNARAADSVDSLSMMVRSTSSQTRPDTLMQDPTLQAHSFLLQRTAGPYISGEERSCSGHHRVAEFGPTPVLCRVEIPQRSSLPPTEVCYRFAPKHGRHLQ